MRVNSTLLLVSLVASFVPENLAMTGTRSRSTRQVHSAIEGHDNRHRRARAGRDNKSLDKDNAGRGPVKNHHPHKVQPLAANAAYDTPPVVLQSSSAEASVSVGKKPEKKKPGSGGGSGKQAGVKKAYKKDEARRPMPEGAAADADISRAGEGPPTKGRPGSEGSKKGRPATDITANDGHNTYYYTPASPLVSTAGVPLMQSGSVVLHGVPAPAPNALSCNQELCTSQPSSMSLFFTGNSCTASRNFQHNAQNNQWYFIDSLIQVPTVYVYVTDEFNGGNVFFSGRVNLGGNVTIDNGSLLPPSLMVTVYDINVTTELQQFRVKSDCMSGLLYIGDTFCGIMVRSVTTPIQGTFGTCTAVYVPPGQPGQPVYGKSGKVGYDKSSKGSKYAVPVVPGNPVLPVTPVVPVAPVAPYLPTPVQAVYPGECDDPAIMIRMQLTGGGCIASVTLNDQGEDFDCVIDLNEAMHSVRVQITAPGNNMLFNSVVAFQDVIELTYPTVMPDMLVVHTISLDGMKDLQMFSFNPSCKKPLAIGDVLGAFTIVGFETPQQGLVTGGMNKPSMSPPTTPPPPNPAPVSVPTPVPPPPQACKGTQCTAMPTRLKIMLTGNACKSGSNSQGAAYTCTDGGMPITFPLNLRIMENNVPIFDDVIPNKDSELVVGNGVSATPVDMNVMIMDAAKANTLQTVTFKTDCVTPLYIGDEFGALKLVEFTNSQGTAGGCKS